MLSGGHGGHQVLPLTTFLGIFALLLATIISHAILAQSYDWNLDKLTKSSDIQILKTNRPENGHLVGMSGVFLAANSAGRRSRTTNNLEWTQGDLEETTAEYRVHLTRAMRSPEETPPESNPQGPQGVSSPDHPVSSIMSRTDSPISAAMISDPATVAGTATRTATTPIDPTQYVTVNYNGIIGVNATDPMAITTESRSFALPTEIQILMCFLYGTLAFTAVTSNMTVCYIVLSNQRMRTATNYFIVNLAVGDILMALLCIPFTFPANLIYQYWPFGLSLCVVVSYSQANSVFISAYTMVAISIDKYIAIMYPMRLRMPKNQAKMIILAIWSAALITSLPTALLSSLTPASPDMTGAPSPTVTDTTIATISSSSNTSRSPSSTTPFQASMSHESPFQSTNRTHHGATEPTRQPLADGSSSVTNSSSASSLLDTPRHGEEIRQDMQQKQNQEYEEDKKYFCQESWLVWPGGKYYYSMALMILQFAVPLFVLIVTYTRIVIVVWGKRAPGEEDNARDARMARSKRKMIRMVIFCVIAFALTWLPFNALIIIGDIRPDIWENQNIMYIWFITHYLAMCHTITNPLIYIWMNNRFRAGFKQVVEDVCKFLRRLFAYILCYCLCFGCCLDCSKRKLARVELSINRKRAHRGPLTSTGSVNAHNHNNNGKSSNNNQQQNAHHYQQHGTQVNQHQLQQQRQLHYSTQTATGHTTTTSNNYYTTITGSAQISTGNANNNDAITTMNANLSSSYTKNSAPGINIADDAHEQERLVRPTNEGTPRPEARRQCPERTRADASKISNPGPHSSDSTRCTDRSSSPVIASAGPKQLEASMEKSATKHSWQVRRFPRCFWTLDEGTGGLDGSMGTTDHRQESDARANELKFNERDSEHDQDEQLSHKRTCASSDERPAAYAQNPRRKRQKRQTHVLSLQMTTSQYYLPRVKNRAGASELRSGCALVPTVAATNDRKLTTSKWRTAVGKRLTRGKLGPVYSTNCPSCREASAGLFGDGKEAIQMAIDHCPNGHVKTGKFMYELRQSSQSSATISAQTNNTSLVISSINSAEGTANVEGSNNSANTSASLSPNGPSSEKSPDASSSLRRQSGRDKWGTDLAAMNCAPRQDDNSINVIRLGQNCNAESGAQVASDAGENVAKEKSRSSGHSEAIAGGNGCGIGLNSLREESDNLKLVRGDDTMEGPPKRKHLSEPIELLSGPLKAAGYSPVAREINVGERRQRLRRDPQQHQRRRQSVGEGTHGYGMCVNEIDASLQGTGGTLSEATSLEDHQLVTTKRASAGRNQSREATGPRQSRHSMESSDGDLVGLGQSFCARHRQTASAVEVNSQACDHPELRTSTPSRPQAMCGSKDCTEIVSSEDEQHHSQQRCDGIFCAEPLDENAYGHSISDQKSNSAFELVSDHLLHAKQILIREECSQAARISLVQSRGERFVLSESNDEGPENQTRPDGKGKAHSSGSESAEDDYHDGDQEDEEDNTDYEYGDENDEDSSLEAEYGESGRFLRQCSKAYRSRGNFNSAELIQLKPLMVNSGSTAEDLMQRSNTLFCSSNDGLHAHTSPGPNYRGSSAKSSTHRSIVDFNATTNLMVAANQVLLISGDVQVKNRGSENTQDACPETRKLSLHSCDQSMPQYQMSHHTKSVPPVHLGRQRSFVITRTNNTGANASNGRLDLYRLPIA